MNFMPPQDRAFYAHQKTLSRFQMNVEFIKTVRDKCKKASAEQKKLDAILAQALDRQLVTLNEMNYASGVFVKVT